MHCTTHDLQYVGWSQQNASEFHTALTSGCFQPDCFPTDCFHRDCIPVTTETVSSLETVSMETVSKGTVSMETVLCDIKAQGLTEMKSLAALVVRDEHRLGREVVSDQWLYPVGLPVNTTR